MTDDRSIEERWERVRALLDRDELDAALSEAERLRNDAPDSAEAVALVGMVHGQRGDVERALLTFDEALAIDPGLGQAKLEKAALLFDEERYEDVVETLEGEESVEALHYAASALYELGEHEEARTVLEKALAFDELPELRHLEALLHLQRAEPENALVSAERAVALDPDQAQGHHTRALALTQLGRIADADAAFARAAALDPENYFAPYRLDSDDFDDVVDEALEDLPEEFQRYLENVEVGVVETPERDVVREGIEFDLLGLYQGGSIQSDSWDFPDRILLFQRNLENISPDRDTLVEEIHDTVFHEVAHHMGMDEEAVRLAEEDDGST